MNLDNLKPAWRKFQLVNSMPSMDQEEILLMLESVESVPLSGTHRVLINILLFIVFTFCFQGG